MGGQSIVSARSRGATRPPCGRATPPQMIQRCRLWIRRERRFGRLRSRRCGEALPTPTASHTPSVRDCCAHLQQADRKHVGIELSVSDRRSSYWEERARHDRGSSYELDLGLERDRRYDHQARDIQARSRMTGSACQGGFTAARCRLRDDRDSGDRDGAVNAASSRVRPHSKSASRTEGSTDARAARTAVLATHQGDGDRGGRRFSTIRWPAAGAPLRS